MRSSWNKGIPAWNRGIDHLSPAAKERIGLANKRRFALIGHPRGMLGKHHTEETLKKLRQWKPSPEQLKKMTHHGENHPRWVKRVSHKCPICKINFLHKENIQQKYCSNTCRNLGSRKKPIKCPICRVAKKWYRGHAHKGKICRKCWAKSISGKNSSWWMGGITPISKKIRTSSRYKKWRTSVFKRDDYTCQWCLRRGGRLHAHHIKSFAKYPKLRFILSNGLTLCVPCHEKTDNYLKR